jgi:demethylmenaquinone methyltransferase/2-methoxy-6-polyprenyl-1,4-benzoquinol methylase
MGGVDYDRVAGFYDALADLYSLGRIRACKRAQLDALGAGDRVLFAGAGRGGEALLAARKGARVTLLDLSPAMLARAAARLRAAGLEDRVELLQGDLLAHRSPEGYDAVVAHFFLNVFPEPALESVLAHLATLARPGGRVLIADFAPAEGHALLRAGRALYFGIAVLAFRMLAGNPMHRLYDYRPLLEGAGLNVERSRTFGWGPVAFRALDATRSG